MAILVTGASGFLGSRLIERLAADGQDIVAVARRPAPVALYRQPNIHWVVQDIAQDAFDTAGLPDIDVVVHLAGTKVSYGNEENLFLSGNEQATVRLFQALAERTDRFIFASSQMVYGDVTDLGVTEDFPLRPGDSPYACSKINSENWLRWFQKHHGGQYLALRFCGFIDGGGFVDYLIDRALLGETITLHALGKVRRDYLPSSEGIDALIAALKYRGEPAFLPVNIGSGQAVSAHELAKLVCVELDSASHIELSTNTPVKRDFVFCINRARGLLDFRPSKLTDAVRHYARHRQGQEHKRANDAKN